MHEYTETCRTSSRKIISLFLATDLIDLRMNIDKTTKDLQDKVFGIYSRIGLLRSQGNLHSYWTTTKLYT